MSDLLKRQFKLLARLMGEIEEMAVRMHAIKLPGLALTSVDTIARQAGLSPQGESTLVAMIKQSERIKISEDRTLLVPRENVIDITFDMEGGT